ncbi:MAG: hypothetical protein ACLR4Z_08080 [Butyricicoccaceae bacterium]
MEALTAASIAALTIRRYVQGGRPRHAHRPDAAAAQATGGRSGEYSRTNE